MSKKVIVVKRKNTSNPSLQDNTNIIITTSNNNNNRTINNATFTRKTPTQDKKVEEPSPISPTQSKSQPTQIQESISEEQKIKNEIDKNIMEQQKREGDKIPARVNRIMIRGIPANVTEEEYAKIMEQHLQKSDHHYFIKGFINRDDNQLGRAYLNFPTKSEAQNFLQLQNQPLFKDSNSSEVPNQISFAPLQKLPPIEAKPDELENTLDKDPEFLSFLEESQKPVENKVSMETIMKERTKLLEQRKEQGATMTPLVKYIIEEKVKDREKENNRIHRERREREKERRSQMRRDREKKLVILKRADNNNSEVIYSSQSGNTSTKEVIIKEGKKIITIKKKNI